MERALPQHLREPNVVTTDRYRDKTDIRSKDTVHKLWLNKGVANRSLRLVPHIVDPCA
jgi:hypothetical protein